MHRRSLDIKTWFEPGGTAPIEPGAPLTQWVRAVNPLPVECGVSLHTRLIDVATDSDCATDIACYGSGPDATAHQRWTAQLSKAPRKLSRSEPERGDHVLEQDLPITVGDAPSPASGPVYAVRTTAEAEWTEARNGVVSNQSVWAPVERPGGAMFSIRCS